MSATNRTVVSTVSDYLDYGGGAPPDALDLAGTAEYLQALGFGNGDLAQARAAVEAHQRRAFVFAPNGANYCDFCMAQLMGGEFDRLKDGRERCIRCSRSVLAAHEDFVEVYEEVKRNLELGFEVQLRGLLSVRMVNASEIARRTGERFAPTPGFDGRVLGFAKKSAAGHELWIENGSPKLAAVVTIAHELTHIWQYANWNEANIDSRYGDRHRLIVYEGMATWVQIQYLYFIKEFDRAEREEAYQRQRQDEYGLGFRMYEERYPLDRSGMGRPDTPFRHPFPI